jgi:hypothetical protein
MVTANKIDIRKAGRLVPTEKTNRNETIPTIKK